MEKTLPLEVNCNYKAEVGRVDQKELIEVRISVRNLVEFVLRSGSIDNRRAAGADNAMQEGGRIHWMLQKRMGMEYQSEVRLKYCYDAGAYGIVVEGRADGIIAKEPETEALMSAFTVDEIKGTYKNLARMKEADPVHLAQAKCYAFIYGTQNDEKMMRVRMTYCNMETEEVRYFHSEYTVRELTDWFMSVMKEYRRWADREFEWKKKRKQSIRQLQFPFPYRDGQKELASYVYQTIYHGKKLFIEAPTGVGKTISTVFPAVKAIGEGKGEKLFYLTAKTITRTVAEEAFLLLRQRGLSFKTVILTAKDKICFMEETECNPDHCPYADGHYDRINEAIYELLMKEDSFTREKIEQYAEAHRVCPFELCLDMSLFSDGIICDYNYLFDPHVYLKRFFADGIKGDYLFLIDEAHNLVDRGREMYSAVLCKEDFLKLKKRVELYDVRMEKQLEKCNKALLDIKRECEDYRILDYIDDFVQPLIRLCAGMEDYLEEHEETKTEQEKEVKKEILDFYFEVSHFLSIYEKVDKNYVVFSMLLQDGRFILKLFCVNPTLNLRDCMKRGRSSILFSATLLPIEYYKSLLGAEEGDYEVYAQSVFHPARKALLIAADVTSKYTRRSEQEYYNIAAYIHEIIKNRHGNYMVFFPSHAFLRQVLTQYETHFLDDTVTECIVQEDFMDEKSREEFLGRFQTGSDRSLPEDIHMEIQLEEDTNLVGFCVLGGIFSEGIDLKNDSLIGAVIVGTGLPQVCTEREILKNYFDEAGDNGFDFAYRYPGMNKVLQAAGRVIRTAEDVGIVALLDERFLTASYQRMFPREWESFETVNAGDVARKVERFWNEWL